VLLDPAVIDPDLGWRLASHRRGARPRRVRDADVDSGKPALADDPRPPDRGARDRRRHRAIASAGADPSNAAAEDAAADAHHTPLREVAHTLFTPIASARWSAWC
jgi:hypothetical protein